MTDALKKINTEDMQDIIKLVLENYSDIQKIKKAIDTHAEAIDQLQGAIPEARAIPLNQGATKNDKATANKDSKT